MNYEKILKLAIRKQDMNLELNEIPFNIFLKNSGDVLTLCFLEEENEECIIISETNMMGFEELRIVPKENIEYISVFYDFSSLGDDDNMDVMFL